MNWAREVVTEFVCSYLIIHACVSEMKHTPRSNLVYRLKINEFRLSLELTVLRNASVAPIEYHTRMPFDCGYDMAVPSSKWAHIQRLFLRLASKPANQMRMIDFRAVTGCMQIGIACGQNESWRVRQVGVRSTVIAGFPIKRRWVLVLFTWTFIQWQIEATLFQTLTTPIQFLENTYHSNLDVCVPKYFYLHKGSFHLLPQGCTGMSHDRLRDIRFSTYDMALLPSLQHLPFHNTLMTSSHAHQNKSWECMQGSGADPDKLKCISTTPRQEPSNLQHIDCYLSIL
uniref:Uncharacterized protein n=1 Tax=Echinococcus canadensis TaxID=519352 RepID=A0A915EUM0_9CEST